MVHGLETLKRLNEKEAGRKPFKRPKEKVPKEIALHPVLLRRYLNRPWQKEDGLREKIRD